MSTKNVASLLFRNVRVNVATSRALSTTRAARLPRQNRPRPPPLPSAASTSALPLTELPEEALPIKQDSVTALSEQVSATPWFLEEEEEIVVHPAATPPPPSHSSWALDSSLPEPLLTLHYLLAEGDCSALIARPDEKGGLDSMTGKRPVTYIHAKEVNEDAWADWIVVIQVKSNAGGSVSRVAKEVGSFLKHALPPSLQRIRREDESVIARAEADDALVEGEKPASSIDDFFGEPTEPLSRKPRQTKAASTTLPSPSTKEPIEEEEKRNWRPYKIISREAQDGLRALHQDDPERWSRQVLAQTFKLSVEGVRRILKSRWRPTGAVIGRQNRRAMERETQKRIDRGWASRAEEETEEIANIRKEMERDNQDVEEDEQEYKLEGEQDSEERTKFTQPVFYEGLVDAGDDLKKGRGKSAARRGDGEWCLVDAGWCVVHVMTAQARTTYDVESFATGISKQRSDDEVVM
ncbi:hypothetical protein CBS101457_006678 [Exobasidium rhododendri]|nr:hypothetical protein CBS101457_006678 [Exobasidium rhododendri]